MDLSIIVVNFNTKEKALVCLKSIYDSDLSGINFEVIMVDNASTEPIENELKQKFPQTKHIISKINLGMGGGNNLGMKNSAGKFVLILNPDTEVKGQAIKTMLDYLITNQQVGLVGPKILYPDGALQDTCFRFPKFTHPFFRRTFLGRLAPGYINNYLMKNSDLSKPQIVDWIMGCCLLIKREVIEKIGMFDERFFLYFEDTDLCRRIKVGGWQVVYLPTAEIIHHHGRASARKSWYLAPFLNEQSRIHIKSWLKYFLKWHLK